ncbi:MAG: hypothetical protein FDZ70_09215 [Actinobacteria bacterium]|nr:MAG: hypothetical protein FDZ70_09215 [Actinomycetota bacterium]
MGFRVETLTERVERNRTRLRSFLVTYVVVSSALVALAVVLGVYGTAAYILVRGSSGYHPDYPLLRALGWLTRSLPLIFSVTWAASAPGFALWCRRTLRRPESRLLERIRAMPVPTGKCRRAKSALHDVAIAAGISVPRLAYVKDECSNAFVIAHRTGTAWIGVTSGLLDLLTLDELRCVFAHLVARIRDGSAVTATLLAELFDEASTAGKVGDRLLEENAIAEEDDVVRRAFKVTVSPAWAFYGGVRLCLAITAVLVLRGYARSQAVSAECADSEGMLLAKDARGMMGALEKVLPADNRLGGVAIDRMREDIFGALFFAWPVFSFDDDPELVRIRRLREVLGAEGVWHPAMDSVRRQ